MSTVYKDLRYDFDDTIVNKYEYNWYFRIPESPNFPEDASVKTRYVVYLPEIPCIADLVNYPIAISGMTMIVGQAPFTGQFRITDSLSRIRPDMIEFNSAQAGLYKTIHFWGLGSVIHADFPNTLQINFEDLQNDFDNLRDDFGDLQDDLQDDFDLLSNEVANTIYKSAYTYNSGGTIDVETIKDYNDNTINIIEYAYNTDGTISHCDITIGSTVYRRSITYTAEGYVDHEDIVIV
jgi:hypothetical protein